MGKKTPAGRASEELPALTDDEQREFDVLCGVVDRNINAFFEVGRALAEIRNKRLYKATHKKFESFCQDRWGLGRIYINRKIAAYRVAQNVIGYQGAQDKNDANWHQNGDENGYSCTQNETENTYNCRQDQDEKVPHGGQNEEDTILLDEIEQTQPMGNFPINEAMIRPLTNKKFDLDDQRKLWQRAVEKAREKNNGRVTSAIVKGVVRGYNKEAGGGNKQSSKINDVRERIGFNPPKGQQPMRMSARIRETFDALLDAVSDEKEKNFPETSREALQTIFGELWYEFATPTQQAKWETMYGKPEDNG